MPLTTPSLYFNTVIQHLHPNTQLQLNPIVLNFQNVTVENEVGGRGPHTVTSARSEHAIVYPHKSEEDSFQREVMLVEIHTSNTTRNMRTGTDTTVHRQHFNLVVIEGQDICLFEPLKTNSMAPQIEKLIAAHFPEHNFFTFKTCHPQVNTADPFCMAYVCMFANAILASNQDDATNYDADVDVICRQLFAKANTAKKVLTFMQITTKSIVNLPAFPYGADWFDDHKAAVIGGGAGLVLGGPVWGILGLAGGEILYDQGHRAGRY